MSLPKPTGRIAVRNVDVTQQPGARPILRQLSFDILPGEIVGVTGASGSGKSTLARLLTGQIAPTDGSVTLDGADVSAWPPDDLGSSLGYMPQDCALFDGTVAENIARFSGEGAAATQTASRVIAAAQSAGVHEVIAGLPEAYETVVSDRSPNLSGGQRQLIALARALYGDVRLVVLDEPSSNLDTAGRKALVASLESLRADRVTALVISHDPVLLRATDRVLVLRGGRLVREGPPQEVVARAGGPQAPRADAPKAAEPSRPTILRPRARQASPEAETKTRRPSR